MNSSVEVIYGPRGEAYLALRKVIPKTYEEKTETESRQQTSRVVIIDMFEDDKEKYEC